MRPTRTFHRRPSMTRKKAAHALDQLLLNCRPEMLATFTAEGLSKTHNITVDKAAQKLAAARADRINQDGEGDAKLIA